MYQVFLRGLHPKALSQSLYSFVPHPGIINFSFLGLINLAEPNIFLAFLAGFLQFYQLKISTASKKNVKGKTTDFSKTMQQQMLYFLLLLRFLLFGSLAQSSVFTGLSLYYFQSGNNI